LLRNFELGTVKTWKCILDGAIFWLVIRVENGEQFFETLIGAYKTESSTKAMLLRFFILVNRRIYNKCY
jgi:hypothetical protein